MPDACRVAAMSSGDEVCGGGVRRVVLARSLPDAEGSGDHTVHLVELPPDQQHSGGMGGVCGMSLRPGQVETVAPDEGVWCTCCVTAHLTGVVPAPDTVREVDTPERVSAASAYRQLGWPVRVREDQLWLNLDLDLDAVAVVIPSRLAGRVTKILVGRRCPPAVLAHPALGTHRVFVAGERYGVALSWPTGVHRVTGTLLLPPTRTAHGPVRWVRPPQQHTLQWCREIDVCAAVTTALREPPPSSPSAF
ncbi:MAG: hypothetical protein ACRDQD_31085 [Nocardioidaceae bacterium]